jgi:plastocyanin
MVEIAVVDEQGRPIADVAVYAVARGASNAPAPAMPIPQAIMDQQNHEFVPHMLVVQAGTEVTFPNSDDVSHHVYSFSPAKTFELGLYKGNQYPPVVFDEPGIVVLGCNIHDSMLGYIHVVDTPYFAVTNQTGVALIDVPAGDYSVEVWTPRARPQDLPAPHAVSVGDDSAEAQIRIGGRLAPPHAHGHSSLTWKRY